jgi:peptidyl-prolyl cis-trans isomerase D
MLDAIRKKKKSVFIRSIFWIIIAAFVGTIFLVWGKGEFGNEVDDRLAVEVNGSRINLDVYEQTRQDLASFYRQIYGGQFSPELEKRLHLPQQALQKLIDQTLLLQEGKRLGITVSKKELIDSIAAIEAFQVDGVFNRQQYIGLLAHQRLTPAQFEQSQRNHLLMEKTQNKLAESAKVSDDDVLNAFKKREEKINLDFVRMKPSAFEEKVTIDNSKLEEFLAEHKEMFRVPEKFVLDYVTFDPANFREQAGDHTPEERERYYNRHREQFEIDESVKVAQIVLGFPENADDAAKEQVRALAEKTLDELRTGADFAKVAAERSADKESAAKEGVMGTFGRDGALAPELEDAVFALRKGQISEPIAMDDGYHLIKLLEYTEAGFKPLETVLDEVNAGLSEEKARALALDKAMDFYNINRREHDLAAAAKAAGMPLGTTPPFETGEAAGDLGILPENAAMVTDQAPGNLTRPMSVGGKIVVMALRERQPSFIPQLAEVHEKVEQMMREESAAQLAKDAAAAILKALADGRKLEEAAQEQHAVVEETGLFTRRNDPFVPLVGNVGDDFASLFQLGEAQAAIDHPLAVGDDFVVITLKEREEANVDLLVDSERNMLRDSLLIHKQQESINNRLAELRKEAKISLGPVLRQIMEER